MSRRPSAAWATIAGCLLGAVASLAVNLTAAAESPDYTARPDQLVTFGSSDRLGNPLTLTAILTKPEGEHRFPAVVVLHGCDGIWLRWDYSWRRRLIDWGYAVLSVDSFSPRGHGNLCTSPGAQMSMDRVGDAHAARAFLAGLPFVNPSRIAVMGMSAGGTAAILSILAPEEPRANPFQAAVALYPACGRALEDRDAPLLVLIAQFDDWMPSRQCLAMRAEGDSPHPLTVNVLQGATRIRCRGVRRGRRPPQGTLRRRSHRGRGTANQGVPCRALALAVRRLDAGHGVRAECER